MKAYYATYNHSFPALVQFEIEKETKGRVYPKAGTNIQLVGDTPGYYGQYINKTDERFFWNYMDALTYLVKIGTLKASSADRNLSLAREHLEMLTKELRNVTLQNQSQ